MSGLVHLGLFICLIWKIAKHITFQRLRANWKIITAILNQSLVGIFDSWVWWHQTLEAYWKLDLVWRLLLSVEFTSFDWFAQVNHSNVKQLCVLPRNWGLFAYRLHYQKFIIKKVISLHKVVNHIILLTVIEYFLFCMNSWCYTAQHYLKIVFTFKSISVYTVTQ